MRERLNVYNKRLETWRKCRDARDGEEPVKARGAEYLPALPDQSAEGYRNYLRRALWYGATGRTVDALLGLMFWRPPKMEMPAGQEWILEDMDGNGAPAEEVAETIADEVITVGRCGLLVDYPEVRPGATRLDIEREQVQPYVVVFKTEDIVSWKYTTVEHRRTLSEVVVSLGLDDSGQERYQVLRLTPAGYTSSIEDSEGRPLERVRIPTIAGKPLNKIPFRFVNPDRGDSPVPPLPPIKPLADVNYSHYMTMADLEHGRFFCGVPTPIFAGFAFGEGDTVKLGSTGGIVAADPQAKAYYLEFTGEGLAALERAADQKEKMMAKLGSRLLTEDRAAAETAEALRIRQSGESAVLSSIAASVSAATTWVLRSMCEWIGADPAQAVFGLSLDYRTARLSAQELDALSRAVQAGTMPIPDFFYALKEGGILAEDRELEDYMEELPDLSAAGAGVEEGAEEGSGEGEE